MLPQGIVFKLYRVVSHATLSIISRLILISKVFSIVVYDYWNFSR